MRVARSNSIGSARNPPEKAYLWVPRDGALGENGLSSESQSRSHDTERIAQVTHRKGSNPKPDNGIRRYNHVSAGGGGVARLQNGGEISNDAGRNGDVFIEASGNRGVTKRDSSAFGSESVRRPVTAAAKSARAASSVTRDSSKSFAFDSGYSLAHDSSTSLFRGASGHSEASVDYGSPGVLSSTNGQSVIYDSRNDRTREQESQEQHTLRLQHREQGRSSSNNNVQIDHIGSSYALQGHSLIANKPPEKNDSDRGKESARHSRGNKHSDSNDKEIEDICEGYSRRQSSLRFSQSKPVSSKLESNGRDSAQFYSTRYKRSSHLFSARSRSSFSHDKTENSRGTALSNSTFHNKTSRRPQTARVEPSRKPGAHIISRYRESLDNSRPATARQQPSDELTFKTHLRQQERNRHQHPSLTRFVNSHHHSSSPNTSASSNGRPQPAPTPNLYRQLVLASPGPSISKNVQLNTGHQRPASETVRRDGTQEVTTEKREALSVQRSQSSLSILGSVTRSGTPSNFFRYNSGSISARPRSKLSYGAQNSFREKRNKGDPNKEDVPSGKDFCQKSGCSSVRITTRGPSSARISLDRKRHNESSKILDLVGRQPGFLSTLALVSSGPALQEERSVHLESFNTNNRNNSNRNTPQDTESNLNINVLSASSRIIEHPSNILTETKTTHNYSNSTNVNSKWQAANDDIYGHFLPKHIGDFVENLNAGLTSSEEVNIETKQSNLKITPAILAYQSHDQTNTSPDEVQPSIFRGDRERRNTSGVVTFDLPDDEDTRSSSIEDSQQVAQDDESDQGETTGFDEENCEMSAPELPPIAVASINAGKGGNAPVGKTPREHKRKTSNNSNHSSGSRTSMHQLSNAVNNKTYFNRKTNNSGNTNSSNHAGGGGGGGTGSFSTNTSTSSKRIKKKRLPIPRNHSDSSLKGLLAQQQQQQLQLQTSSFTGSSCSSNILPNGTGDGMMGVGDGGASNSRQIKYMANGSRALSWCATENSGSQLKLETLFEGQNNHQGLDSDPAPDSSALSSAKGMSGIVNSSIYSGRILASPLSNHMHRTESNTSINNMLSSTNGRTSTPPIMMNNNTSRTSTPPIMITNNTINSINNFRAMNNHSSLSGQFGVGLDTAGRKTASVKGGGGATDMPPILPPRSVSVNGIRSRDDIARLVALNRFGETSAEDGAEIRVDSVEDILARGHLRRSQSENRLHGRLANGGILNPGVGDNIEGEGSPGKLQGGPNTRQSGPGKSLSRNLSVDRLDRLTARPGQKRPSRVGSYTNVNNYGNGVNNNNNNNTYNKQTGGKTSNNTSGGGGRLRKVSSMSAMPVDRINNNNNSSYSNNNTYNNNNTTRTNNKTGYARSKTGQNNSSPTRYHHHRATSKRYTSHRDSVMDEYDNQGDDTPPEDEESIEASARLVEWLNVVNNIEEYDTDPQHTVVEYADEPPQTDTAVHVVYEVH